MDIYNIIYIYTYIYFNKSLCIDQNIDDIRSLKIHQFACLGCWLSFNAGNHKKTHIGEIMYSHRHIVWVRLTLSDGSIVEHHLCFIQLLVNAWRIKAAICRLHLRLVLSIFGSTFFSRCSLMGLWSNKHDWLELVDPLLTAPKTIYLRMIFTDSMLKAFDSALVEYCSNYVTNADDIT